MQAYSLPMHEPLTLILEGHHGCCPNSVMSAHVWAAREWFELFSHAEFALIIPELCKIQVISRRLGLEPKLLTAMRGSRCSRSRFETEMTLGS